MQTGRKTRVGDVKALISNFIMKIRFLKEGGYNNDFACIKLLIISLWLLNSISNISLASKGAQDASVLPISCKLWFLVKSPWNKSEAGFQLKNIALFLFLNKAKHPIPNSRTSISQFNNGPYFYQSKSKNLINVENWNQFYCQKFKFFWNSSIMTDTLRLAHFL